MSPRSEEQFEAIRQKSRQAILKTALKLFARKGFAATTTADIARSVGISKGLVYNYFSNKEEILECLITESVRAAIPMLTAQNDESDPKTQMEELIRQWIRLIKSDSDLMRLVLQLHTSGAFRKLVDRRAGELYEMLADGLKGIFQRLGSHDPELDAMLLGSMLDGISLNYTSAPQFFPIDKMEKRLIQMYCTPQGKIP